MGNKFHFHFSLPVFAKLSKKTAKIKRSKKFAAFFFYKSNLICSNSTAANNCDILFCGDFFGTKFIEINDK